MLAARPPVRRPEPRRERWSRSRRAFAAVACVGATFAYGGLSAAGALPAAVDVPHHVHVLFGGDRTAPAHRSPTTDAAVPGNRREHVLPTPASRRRAGVPPATSHTPGGGVLTPAPTTSVAPGHSGTAPGQGTTPPGQGGTPPGRTEASPGSTPNSNGNGNAAAHANPAAPGQAGTTPAQGELPPGQSGTAPGQGAPNASNDNSNANADHGQAANDHANSAANDKEDGEETADGA
jgi:hypothetical protein